MNDEFILNMRGGELVVRLLAETPVRQLANTCPTFGG